MAGAFLGSRHVRFNYAGMRSIASCHSATLMRMSSSMERLRRRGNAPDARMGTPGVVPLPSESLISRGMLVREAVTSEIPVKRSTAAASCRNSRESARCERGE